MLRSPRSPIWFITALAAVAGCAHTKTIIATESTPSAEAVEPTVEDDNGGIMFVGKIPPSAHYKAVGSLTGVSSAPGFVEAVREAKADIRRKAAALNATRIKIDKVRVPSEGAARGGEEVYFLGRAYRAR